MIICRCFLIAVLLYLTLSGHSSGVEIPPYGVALLPSPVLNTPDFAAVFGGSDGQTLRTDPSGLVREVEFVALPGTQFRIHETLVRDGAAIYRVTTEEYPYPAKEGYYIDSRFVETYETPPPPTQRTLPPREKVIENLFAARGSRYVWGGNYRAGVPQMLTFYPPKAADPLPPATLAMWQLAGVDCSGLLYEATDGFTPRNTSSLVEYGRPVPIAGLDPAKIIDRLEPLDLIVWSGHVMIVIDRARLIESRLGSEGKNGGVVLRPLKEALKELLQTRTPVDEYRRPGVDPDGVFVIRRWAAP